MTLYVLKTRGTDKSFIKYDSEGTFKLEDCYVGHAEPFNSWAASERLWNYNFMILSGGTFQLINSDFVGVVVKNIYNLISAKVNPGNNFLISGCNFNSCGCSDETGSPGNGVIYVGSDSVGTRTSYSLNVTNSNFISCFGYDGGAFKFFFFLTFIIFLFLFI
jgi:hypothetical protein